MSFARALGDAIVNPPEQHSPRWWISRITPPTVTAAEFAMAIATLLHHTNLGKVEHLLVAARFLDKAASATHVDPAVTLAALALAHIGGNRIMALLENLLKPLLNAQREAGIEIGRAEGEAQGRAEGEAQGRAEANAQFEAWKASQRAAGVQFAYGDPTEDQPTLDQ